MLEDNISGDQPALQLGDLLGGQLNGHAATVIIDSSGSQVAVDFLRGFDETGRHNLIAIDPDTEATKGRTFEPGDWAGMSAWIAARNGLMNLYFSVNEPAAGAPHAKLSKADIRAIRGLAVDIDFEDGQPLAAERDRLGKLALDLRTGTLPPSCAIDSGGGVQLFWWLAEKLDAVPAMNWAEDKGRRLAHWLSGDAVQNIDRIMRLPGTENIPNAKKIARGRVRHPTSVIYCDDRAYDQTAFNAIASVQAGAGATNSSQAVRDAEDAIDMAEASQFSRLKDLSEELKGRLKAAFVVDPKFEPLLRGDPTARGGTDHSSSGWRAALVARMARHGFTAHDYACVAHAWDRGWPTGGVGSDLTLRDLSRDWGRCAALVQPPFDLDRWFDKPAAEKARCAADSGAVADPEMEPIDIFGGASPSELAEPPLGALPDVIDRVARDEAVRKGVPLAFAAISLVTAVGAAVGCSLRIRPRLHDDGWTEPAALWSVLVAPPGSAKSPIISAATAPLKQRDKEWHADFVRRHQIWAETKRSAKKGDPVPLEPKSRRIVVDDVTMERQIQIHAENPRGLVRLPDEYVGLLGSLGAYKKGPDADRGHMLRLFDGGIVGVDRVGSGSTRAESALMALLAGTQPGKLQTLVRDLGADGILQRTLFILHDGHQRRGQDSKPDRKAAAAYARTIRAILDGSYPIGTHVELSATAYQALEAAQMQISALAHIPGMSEAWGGHVEKWGRILPRITLIFHVLDQIALFETVVPGQKVCRSTAEQAVRFARFILRHSLQFYLTYFEPNAAASEARQIAGYILTKPDIQVLTRRDIYSARKSLRGDKGYQALQLAMSELVAAGWCQPGGRDEHGPKEWWINPKVHERFNQRAEWERDDRQRKQALIVQSGKARRAWLDGHGLEGGVA